MALDYEKQLEVMANELKQARTVAQNVPNVQTSTPAQNLQKPVPAKRTRYASIVALNSSNEEAKDLLAENEGWKQVTRKVTKTVRDNINVDRTGALRNKIHLKSGKVILEGNTRAQNEAIKTALTGVPGIKVKELANQNPTVVLTGVEKCYDEQGIIREIYKQNEQIRMLCTTVKEWQESIKYLTRKECRNKDKENWVFQVTPKLYSFLEREGRVVLD